MNNMYGRDGEYVYLGLENQLVRLLQSVSFSKLGCNILELLINIDGLSLFKSSAKQFWPILCQVTCGDFVSSPLIAGIFCGSSKPVSAQIFLADFIAEVNWLKQNNVTVKENTFLVKIKGFVCDAPARTFIKCIKGHTAFYGCERCEQKEKRVKRRIVYPELNAAKRTDESFKNQTQAQHHKSDVISPLFKLGVGLISQIPLEYMHLLCLGACRRILLHLLRGSRKVKISMTVADLISAELTTFAKHIPSEFARKPRTLKEIDRWKATEFRLFLCYVGPVVLRSHLPSKVYHHFMLLHVAVCILTNPDLSVSHCDYAETLLNQFVEQMCDVYGDSSKIYTLHSRVHICDDVRQFGELDSYSAFPFENALGAIKKMLRSAILPLQQLCRRLSEKNPASFALRMSTSLQPKLFQQPRSGPTLGIAGDECKQVTYGCYTYSASNSDGCTLLHNDKIILICNIVASDNIMVVIGQVFNSMKRFYSYPCDSRDLKVYRVAQLSDRFYSFPLSYVVKKCILLPHKDYFVVYPLQHGHNSL